MSVLTATGAVVFAALLRVAFEATVEAMLPELWKPGVPVVVLGTQLQVVLVEPLHVSRLELDGNSTGRFLHEAVRDIVTVRPTIAAKQRTERRAEAFSSLTPTSMMHSIYQGEAT